MKRPVIVLTGGGTAGHVSVNEALIPSFLEKGYAIHYIGSHDGIEKELIQGRHPEVAYHAIQSGKLRRYFSIQNFTDPFKVGVGILQAYQIIKKLKPEVIFSKGGFVSVPVVLGAKLANVKVIIHESDVTPGLANKLALPFASHIFTVFEETLRHLSTDRATCTGAIIRPELFTGNRQVGLRQTNLTDDKPVLLIMGGSQGSAVLNDAIRKELTDLLERYHIIHLCGKGNLDASIDGIAGYVQYEYVTDELPHLLATADLVISRAGSNAIFELLALRKPMMLIPLSAAQSRGDQLLNANLFQSFGYAQVIQEEQLQTNPISSFISTLEAQKRDLLHQMEKAPTPKTPEEMVEMILSYKN